MTARIINSKVHRPKPTAEWRHEWRKRPGQMSTAHYQETKVEAHYAADMVPVLDEQTPEEAERQGEREPIERPNGLVIVQTSGEGKAKTSIRLTRSAAEQLVVMLQAALEWDGR